MIPEFKHETRDDGTRVVRRFEAGVLVHEGQYLTLPSSKAEHREFDEAGRLTAERHGYGMLAIALHRTYPVGSAVEETYYVKRRLVPRAAYEKARLQYPDMPAADGTLPDVGKDLSLAVAADTRRERERAKRHVPDAERAAKLDHFCRGLVQAGGIDAREWIPRSRNRLGVRSRRASVALVASLLKHAAGAIWVCDTEVLDVDGETSDHLVVELPNEPGPRAQLLRYLARLAREQGYSGDVDDGQRFAYVKLA
jgi:hypothetical protein